MRRVIVAISLSLVLVAAACGSDGGKKDATDVNSTTSTTGADSDSTTTSAPGTPTTPTVPAECHPEGATSLQSDELSGVPQLLNRVAVTSTTCTDSITFGFLPNTAPRPSYTIEYADGPFTNSAGQPVKPPGTTYLKVRFQPAWIADLNQASAPLTYSGPRVITPTGTSVVRGLAMYDAAEGVVGWIIGIDGMQPFTVVATPSNVVINVSRAA